MRLLEEGFTLGVGRQRAIFYDYDDGFRGLGNVYEAIL